MLCVHNPPARIQVVLMRGGGAHTSTIKIMQTQIQKLRERLKNSREARKRLAAQVEALSDANEDFEDKVLELQAALDEKKGCCDKVRGEKDKECKALEAQCEALQKKFANASAECKELDSKLTAKRNECGEIKANYQAMSHELTKQCEALKAQLEEGRRNSAHFPAEIERWKGKYKKLCDETGKFTDDYED